MLALLGLHDDYAGDGAAIAQIVNPSALPWSIRVARGPYDRLEAALKQVDAPFGEFGMNTLKADTTAVESLSPGDSTYTGMDSQLQTCETARQALVARIQSVLGAAEGGFGSGEQRRGRFAECAGRGADRGSRLARGGLGPARDSRLRLTNQTRPGPARPGGDCGGHVAATVGPRMCLPWRPRGRHGRALWMRLLSRPWCRHSRAPWTCLRVVLGRLLPFPSSPFMNDDPYRSSSADPAGPQGSSR